MTPGTRGSRPEPEATSILRRALDLQAALEREGRVVNPYHLLEATPSPAVDAPLGLPVG